MTKLVCGLSVVAAFGCVVAGKATTSGTSPTGAPPNTAPTAAPTAARDEPPPPAPSGDPNAKVPMPDLIGKTEAEATAALRAAGIVSELETNSRALVCKDAAQNPDHINCQSPEAGRPVYKHGIINVTVYHPQTFSGSLTRAQMEKVVGMTIADAKKYLKSLGHDGEVKIYEQYQFSEKCGQGRVCGTNESSGAYIHGEITLIVNPSPNVDITMPK